MTSPFAPYKNALLRFEVASGALVPDSKGNLRPGTAVVEVEALLSQKRAPNNTPRPGVDESAIYLEGYPVRVGSNPVQPQPMPSVVAENSKCEATWQGRSGEFFLEFTAPNPYVRALGIFTVDKLRGWFKPGSFTVSGDTWERTPALPAGNQYSELTAAVALSALRLVATNDSGQLVYVSSSNTAQAFRVTGLTVEAIAPSNFGRVLTDGRWTDANWNWSLGAPIFAGLNGQLTQTPPEAGFLIQVATPVTPQTIDFEIQEPVLL